MIVKVIGNDEEIKSGLCENVRNIIENIVPQYIEGFSFDKEHSSNSTINCECNNDNKSEHGLVQQYHTKFGYEDGQYRPVRRVANSSYYGLNDQGYCPNGGHSCHGMCVGCPYISDSELINLQYAYGVTSI